MAYYDNDGGEYATIDDYNYNPNGPDPSDTCDPGYADGTDSDYELEIVITSETEIVYVPTLVLIGHLTTAQENVAQKKTYTTVVVTIVWNDLGGLDPNSLVKQNDEGFIMSGEDGHGPCNFMALAMMAQIKAGERLSASELRGIATGLMEQDNPAVVSRNHPIAKKRWDVNDPVPVLRAVLEALGYRNPVIRDYNSSPVINPNAEFHTRQLARPRWYHFQLGGAQGQFIVDPFRYRTAALSEYTGNSVNLYRGFSIELGDRE